MLFNSVEFLIFLPVVMYLFSMVNNKRALLLVSSYFFYMYWNPFYIILIVFSTLSDFFIARKIEQTVDKTLRKTLLLLSLFLNLGLLFIFKYYNFFVTEILYRPDIITDFLLPVGISFYTFQTMSYTIDVYGQKSKAERNLLNFALYVCYFPQLVAGPIEKASSLIPQIKNLKDKSIVFDGLVFKKIFFGFFKKLVIADRIEIFINHIYSNPTASSLDLIIAAYLFSIQIYCDFSGYCDIAVGVSRIFGINLMENFNRPYFSKTIKEFWSRWHISLSLWFQEYLYIPLGGSKKGMAFTYFNLIVVFLVSGLWHGANWNFVIWGAINGVYLVFGKIVGHRIKIHSFLKIFICFHLVTFSWIFFRIESFTKSLSIIKRILDLDFHSYDLGAPLYDLFLGTFFIVLLFAFESFEELKRENFNVDEYFSKWQSQYIAILILITFSVFTNNSFLYFQF